MITNRNNRSQQRQNERNVDRYTHYVDRLTELSLAMFEWKNVPDEVDLRYMEYLLFTSGQCVFFKDDDLEEDEHFLVTRTALQGKLNIYDIPINRIAYANNGYRRELTEDDSVIIYNNMIRTPAGLDVIMFARDLANIDEIVQVNINAQKTPVLIEADEKQRVTMLNLYRKYSGNEPFIFGNKTMDLGSGLKVLKTDAPFLADSLYRLKTQIWNEALTYLGISNINITKKERLITDEVTRNQGGTIASRYSRLESRRTACKKINNLFGLEMWVDYREDYQSTELVASDTVSGDPNSDGLGGEEINPIEKTAPNLETNTVAEPETKSDNAPKKNGLLETIIQLLKGGE